MVNSGEEKPWNIIIVNQIPKDIDRDKFITIFAAHGKIEDIYLPTGQNKYSNNLCYQEFAVIKYKNEEDADSVFNASVKNEIKYNDEILMITKANDDYCPVETIPDSCLREIFLCLDDPEDKFNCELVSKRWKAIGKQSWSNITAMKNHKRQEEIVERAKESLRHVTIELSKPSGILKNLADNCKGLVKFSLSVDNYDFNQDIHHLRTLMEENKELLSVELHFENMEFENELELTSVLPDNLERFVLSMREVEVVMANPLDLSRFRTLRVLSLVDAHLQGIELKGLAQLVHLKKLKLNASNVEPSQINQILHFKDLEHLSIPKCQISDEALKVILQSNLELKYLDISYNTNITDQSFSYVQKLPKLRVLLMRGLIHVTEQYFNEMPSVEVVNLNFCTMISNDGIMRFLKTSNYITTLYIDGTAVDLKCIPLIDEWTQSTEKSLMLIVSDDIVEAIENEDIDMNDELCLRRASMAQQDEDPRDDSWFEGFCSDTFYL